jgi:hypothetical protein
MMTAAWGRRKPAIALGGSYLKAFDIKILGIAR